MERFKFVEKSKLNELPKTPGVYCFISRSPKAKSYKLKANPIYIGKAINLRDRVKNHFNQPSYRDNLFMEQVDKIGYLETGSEIEALVLEAGLIKKYQPKYNVVWRDDKNYFYVAFEKNNAGTPFVYITHQPHLKAKSYKLKADFVGPFVEGAPLKKTLRFLRRVFPYYTSAKHQKNKCTWCHLDLCPGAEPDLNAYKKNIKKLILILQGKRGAVLSSLRKEMKQLSKESKFEEAGKIRDRIYNLQQVMAHTSVISSGNEQAAFFTVAKNTVTLLQGTIGLNKKISRIECYDVSNIQGKSATGSMVVFVGGQPDKSQYKKFRIKTGDTPNDIAMLKEVIGRRLAHEEWPYPDVMLIDGGKGQLNAAIKTKKLIKLKAKS